MQLVCQLCFRTRTLEQGLVQMSGLIRAALDLRSNVALSYDI
jgi:hypothetical protein